MKYLGLPLGAGLNRNLFGTLFWRKWKGHSQGGSICISRRVVE